MVTWKTFWGTAKKCESKNFKLIFSLCLGSAREGLIKYINVSHWQGFKNSPKGIFLLENPLWYFSYTWLQRFKVNFWVLLMILIVKTINSQQYFLLMILWPWNFLRKVHFSKHLRNNVFSCLASSAKMKLFGLEEVIRYYSDINQT